MAMRRILAVFATTFFIQAAGMITGVMTARLLGPEGRGILAQLLSWGLVLSSLGGLSLAEAVIYYTARHEHDEGRIDTLRAGLVVACITALATLGVAALTVPWMFDFRGDLTLSAVLLASLVIPTNQISLVMAGHYQATSIGRIWSAIRLGNPVIALVAIGIFVAMRDRVHPMMFLLPPIIGSIYVLIIGFWFVRGRHLAGRLPRGSEMTALLKYALRVHPSALGAQREHWDRLIVSYCIGAFAMGQYAVASTLPAAMMALAVTIDTLLFPHFVRKGATIAAILQPARMALYLVMLGGCFIAVVCWLSIPTIFGQAFTPAVKIALVMSMTYTAIAMRFILGSAFKAVNLPFRHGRGDLIAFGLTMLLMPAGALTFGGLGAALAALTIQVIVLCIGFNAFQRHFDIPWWHLLRPSRQDVTLVLAQIRTLARRG